MFGRHSCGAVVKGALPEEGAASDRFAASLSARAQERGMLLFCGLVSRKHRLNPQFLSSYGLRRPQGGHHRKIIQYGVALPETDRNHRRQWHGVTAAARPIIVLSTEVGFQRSQQVFRARINKTPTRS